MISDGLLLFAGLWTFNTVVLLPLLAGKAVRRLFRPWPTDFRTINYTIGTGLFSLFHVLAIILALILNEGQLSGPGAFTWVAGITMGVALFSWLVLSYGFSMVGWWNPNTEGEGRSGRLVLGLGVFWYLFCVGAGSFVVLVVVIAIGFPG
jgi:hypothetical protein